MIKQTLRNPALRKRATQFSRLVRHSAVTRRCGETHKPRLATNGELGITFIGHADPDVTAKRVIDAKGLVVAPGFIDMLGQSETGVLIDNACGGKDTMKTEADAAKHPISCAKKAGCAASGYQLVVGDKPITQGAAAFTSNQRSSIPGHLIS